MGDEVVRVVLRGGPEDGRKINWLKDRPVLKLEKIIVGNKRVVMVAAGRSGDWITLEKMTYRLTEEVEDECIVMEYEDG